MMKQTVQLPFIVSTSGAKPDSKTQLFIRSHVMKGKNKGKADHIRRKGTMSAARTGVAVNAESPGPTIWDYRPLGFIPKRVGSELSFIPFADEIDSSLAAPVVKCIHNGPLVPQTSALFCSRGICLESANVLQVISVSKAPLFPLESCINFQEPPRASWVETLCTDAAYLNATIFSVQVYYDLLAGRDLEPVSPLTPTYTSFSKTVRFLRERLGDEDEQLKVSDNTVMVVLILACHAHRLGQYSTARNHMVGLRKIVNMKGGITALKTRTKLLIEIFRYTDLRFSLIVGCLLL